VRAPPVEAEQDCSIRIQDLTKVVMGRRRLKLAEERLVPFQAASLTSVSMCRCKRSVAIVVILLCDNCALMRLRFALSGRTCRL
jgi:hypothetical protein